MRLLTVAIAVIAMSIGFNFVFEINSAYAALEVSPKKKFTSKESQKYIGERYIDGCKKQYMSQFDLSSLTPVQSEGFKEHSRTVCSCLLKRSRQIFTPSQMSDIARLCCTMVEDLVTPEKSREYFTALQKKYYKTLNNRGYTKQCGFVLDGVDLILPRNKNEKRIQ